VATLLAARDQGLPQRAAAAVFSPWADITRSGSSMRTIDKADPLFSYDAIGWYADRYLPAGDRSAPLASPVFATLSGLPPLLIQVGSHEVSHVFQLYFGLPYHSIIIVILFVYIVRYKWYSRTSWIGKRGEPVEVTTIRSHRQRRRG